MVGFRGVGPGENKALGIDRDTRGIQLVLGSAPMNTNTAEQSSSRVPPSRTWRSVAP